MKRCTVPGNAQCRVVGLVMIVLLVSLLLVLSFPVCGLGSAWCWKDAGRACVHNLTGFVGGSTQLTYCLCIVV